MASPPAPCSHLEDHLGFWLRFVSNHVSGRFQRLLEAEGCTVTEWVALHTLFDRASTTHADLIESLGMTKGAASKVVSRLEEKGWARRELSDGSAREQVLVLTAAGKRLVPKLAALGDENEEHYFAHLGAAQRTALRETFRQLVAHHGLKKIPTE